MTLSAVMMIVIAGRLANGGNEWKDFTRGQPLSFADLYPCQFVLYPLFTRRPSAGANNCVSAGNRWDTSSLRDISHPSDLRMLRWSLPLEPSFTVYSVFDLAFEWYPSVAAVLALMYVLIGRWLHKSKSESGIVHNYVTALNTTGLTLIGLTLLSGYVTAFYGKTWEAVAALTLASLDLALCSFLFRKARYTALASGLFVIPLTLGFARWLMDSNIPQPIGWITAAWIGLGLLYICIGALLRNMEPHADWVYVWGHTITLAALVHPSGGLPAQFWELEKCPRPCCVGTTRSRSICSHSSYRIAGNIRRSQKYRTGFRSASVNPSSYGYLPSCCRYGFRSSGAGVTCHSLWLGATLVALSLVYLGIGQQLFKRVQRISPAAAHVRLCSLHGWHFRIHS